MHSIPPTEYEQIAELAYRIYEQEGQPEGKAEIPWERAERALRQLKLSEPPGGHRPEPSSEKSAEACS